MDHTTFEAVKEDLRVLGAVEAGGLNHGKLASGRGLWAAAKALLGCTRCGSCAALHRGRMRLLCTWKTERTKRSCTCCCLHPSALMSRLPRHVHRAPLSLATSTVQWAGS